MLELTPAQKRELRAQAHHINPVVSISQKGLQPSVLGEIDRSLKAHELIKVRLYGIEREERAALIEEVCGTLACANVQHIGNLLVLWRPSADAPGSDSAKSALAGRRRSKEPLTKKQAAAAAEKRGKPTTPRRAPRSGR